MSGAASVSGECVAGADLVASLVERLRSFIQQGGFRAGDRLPTIKQMARSLGAAPLTLRQALAVLEAGGVIEIKHGLGVYMKKEALLLPNPLFATKVTKKLLLDLVEARIQIETRAIGLAAVHASEVDLMRMEALLAEAEAYIGDDARLAAANRTFHQEIAVASGNAILAQLQDVLACTFQQEQQTLISLYGSHEEDFREHEGLLRMLLIRDASLARERMKAHFNGLHQAVLRWDASRVLLG